MGTNLTPEQLAAAQAYYANQRGLMGAYTTADGQVIQPNQTGMDENGQFGPSAGLLSYQLGQQNPGQSYSMYGNDGTYQRDGTFHKDTGIQDAAKVAAMIAAIYFGGGALMAAGGSGAGAAGAAGMATEAGGVYGATAPALIGGGELAGGAGALGGGAALSDSGAFIDGAGSGFGGSGGGYLGSSAGMSAPAGLGAGGGAAGGVEGTGAGMSGMAGSNASFNSAINGGAGVASVGAGAGGGSNLLGTASTLLGALSGSQGVQKSEVKDIPDWLKPYAAKVLGYGGGLLDQQMQPGALAGYDQMRSVGQGLLSQPIAGNGVGKVPYPSLFNFGGK